MARWDVTYKLKPEFCIEPDDGRQRTMDWTWEKLPDEAAVREAFPAHFPKCELVSVKPSAVPSGMAHPSAMPLPANVIGTGAKEQAGIE
jgi:hypothetical protein